MTDSRIYRVRPKDAEQKLRLVRAANRAQALRHVAEDLLDVGIPTQDELVEAVEAGTKVEKASAEPKPELMVVDGGKARGEAA